MWGKHDETRALLKGAMEALQAAGEITAGEAKALIALALQPASNAVLEMVEKEEQILLPMALDTLTDAEWYAIAQQSLEYGFCLYDPVETWRPEGVTEEEAAPDATPARIQLPSGSFTTEELTAVLNTIPFDMTFVDANDTVRYFTQGTERIFARSRAILGRKVQFCHPPSSVKVVEQILSDFRSGRHNRATFWIQLKGRFICIEYFALRGAKGEYLGCLEVSQDLTEKRALQGEQRLLSYTDRKEGDAS
ncbi:MAG: PAS domain-containing protein, partial [Armatimonadota bacterium]|nr:PAS domain-containing protein [Armatimonadota bacterium]